MQPNSMDPVAQERLSHAGKVFTCDLSINEFALLRGAGFEPIDLVMGVSVYHVGFQTAGLRQQGELAILTEATYRARWNAMTRMQAEADALQADGIVGVRLEWRPQGENGEHLEFIAVGTAVRYSAQPGIYRRPNGQAFSSHLSGQDMITLLRSGYAPVAFVMGNCVYHVAVQGFMQTLVRSGRTPKCHSGRRATTNRANSRCRGCRPKPSVTAPTAWSECTSGSRTTFGVPTPWSSTRPAPRSGRPDIPKPSPPIRPAHGRLMGLDHHRVSTTVSGALSGPGGVALVVKVFAGLPGVTYTPAQRGLFSKSPERIQIGDWRYELAPDGRLRAAHLVHGIVIAEESLDAAVVGPHLSRALGQVVNQYGETILPSIDAALDALSASTGN